MKDHGLGKLEVFEDPEQPGQIGVEYACPEVGFIGLLLTDGDGNLTVVELKTSEPVRPSSGRSPNTWDGSAGTPKSHRARTIVIPRFLAEELVSMTGGEDLIFTSPTGQPLRSPNFLRRVWQPAVTESGLGDLVPHDLRHTAASLAISAGASLKAVQLMLGHASAQITLDRYSHLYEDDLEDLADSMDARYGAAQVRPKPESGDIVDLSERRKRPTYQVF
jgi:hypothetical protein